MKTENLDSNLNKLRAQAVLELIRLRLEDDCTDADDASGGHLAYMNIMSLCMIMMEARGFDDEGYDRLRDAAVQALDLGEDDVLHARSEAIQAFAVPLTADGLLLSYRREAAPF